MRNFSFCLLITSALLYSCTTQTKSFDETLIKISDTSRFTLLHFQKARTFPFDSTFKEVKLSDPELELALSLFSKSLKKYNDIHAKYPIELYKDDYKLQLIAALNSNNEKVVWINGFCYDKHFSYWRQTYVWVQDGGQCFFGVSLNLSKRTFTQIRTNWRA